MILARSIRNKFKPLISSIIRSSQIITYHSMEKKEEVKEPLIPAPAPAKEEHKITITVPIPEVKVADKSFGGRIRIRHLMENSAQYYDKIIKVCGWARTLRFTKKIAFVELTDGSGPLGIQIVVDKDVPNYAELEKMRAGCSLAFIGKIVKSPGAKQPIEMQVKKDAEHKIIIFGNCPAEEYPLAKKEHTVEVY